MPGPVSDAYDPEFGTASNAADVAQAVRRMYREVSAVLGNRPPMSIVELVHSKELIAPIATTFSEQEWRIIRFALERAGESL